MIWVMLVLILQLQEILSNADSGNIYLVRAQLCGMQLVNIHVVTAQLYGLPLVNIHVVSAQLYGMPLVNIHLVRARLYRMPLAVAYIVTMRSKTQKENRMFSPSFAVVLYCMHIC